MGSDDAKYTSFPPRQRVPHSHVLSRVTMKTIPSICHCTNNAFMAVANEMGRNVEEFKILITVGIFTQD